jgi:anthranilate synthase/phosphoribosyltransferase
MILIIDNYDSFTYNIFQYFAQAAAPEEVRVVRNDEIDIAGIEALGPSRLVISPGPGRPEDAGVSVAAIRHFAGKLPILGICLGHQAIGYAFGARIVGAKFIKHGVAEEMKLDGRGLFRPLGTQGTFTRYHSLVVSEESLSPELEVTARASDGDIMGIRHRTYDIEGVQFHPESIASEGGMAMIASFLRYRREPFAFKATLERLLAGKDLDRAGAEAFMEELTDGALDVTKTAVLLTALAAKGPSPEEIAGCAAVLRRKKTPFRSMGATTDTCGTGGDGCGSFNISSMAALAAAACGIPIAKHGNRAVSSRSGSADFYEALGVPVNVSPEIAEELLARTNFAFLFAPVYHGAMRFAGPARKALGVKTIMNLVGPLSNPADAKYQLIGVYDKALLKPVARAARLLGVERVVAVCSRDGMDEISPCAPTDAYEIDAQGVESEYVIDPQAMGFGGHLGEELRGGDAADNAKLALALLDGAGRPALQAAVALNAGAALYVAGAAASIESGARAAAAALADGRVAAKLKELKGGVCAA